MKRLRITIGNKSYEVTVEDLTETGGLPLPPPSAQTETGPPAHTSPPATSAATPKPQLPIESGAVTSPMAGAIKSILVKQGDPVKQGQALVVLEAMKMENQITAPVAGNVKNIAVAEGDSVTEGHVLLVLE